MKKRVLSLILCGVMLLSSVPLSPLADIFTIEAFAADVSELQKVVSRVPDEEDWDLYINTSVLEAYYKSAKTAIALSAFWSQEDVDQLAKDLQKAIDDTIKKYDNPVVSAISHGGELYVY